MPDGSKVRPTTAQTFGTVEVPTGTAAQKLVAGTRRKLVDMPAVPKHLNSYAVVLVYTASGLSDTEISVATGFLPEQINHIRSQPAYTQLEGMIVETVKEQAASTVKQILVAGEVTAAKKLVELAEAEDDRIALSAVNSLLDRGGHKAAEKIDINTHMRQTFRIEVVDKRDSVQSPVIDMEVE